MVTYPTTELARRCLTLKIAWEDVLTLEFWNRLNNKLGFELYKDVDILDMYC
jgi:hypothetical protein